MKVFIPHLLGAIGAILSFLIFAKWAEHQLSDNLFIMIIQIGVIFLIYVVIFLIGVSLTPDKWIRAKPTEGWGKEIQIVDTAIILGFGFEEDKSRNMKAGDANKFLLKWVIENTLANIILVQEGVWVAGCKTSDTTCSVSDREIKRIHSHKEGIYVNTLEAAFYAIEQMEKLGKKKAILVAHHLQLQRAALDFEIVRQTRKNWQDAKQPIFVIPQIPNTPYPHNSKHFQTRNQYFYKIIELLISRPRDFFSRIPTKYKNLNNITRNCYNCHHYSVGHLDRRGQLGALR